MKEQLPSLDQLDQSTKSLADCWYRLFSELTNNGFTREEAIDLLKTWIMSQKN